jgi:hypothetical protein
MHDLAPRRTIIGTQWLSQSGVDNKIKNKKQKYRGGSQSGPENAENPKENRRIARKAPNHTQAIKKKLVF